MKKLLSVMLVLVAVLGICAYANPVLDTAEAAGEANEQSVSAEVFADETEDNLAELAEVSELKWDFETEDSQTWSNRRYNTTYKNGIMYLDSSVVDSSSNYISHSAVSSEDITNTDVLNYLVVKARSLGAVSNIKFYFSTSDYGYAANGTETYVNIPLIPNGSVFEEYVVDMSAHERWSGNYKGCMFQLSGTSGIVEIEEIKFVSEYIPETDMYHEYHIDITSTNHFTAWGHSYADVNDDGTVNFGKKIVYITPNYDKGETATHYYDEETDSYVLISTDNPLPEGATGYKIQNEGAVYIYPRAELNASHYNKLVVKAKGGNVDSVKTYYSTTGDSGYNEAKTMSVGPATGSDGFTYYIFDYSKNTNYSGKVKEFMVVLNSYGETVLHDIYLTNDTKVTAELKPYVWDFEGLSTVDEGKNAGLSAWSGHTSISFDGECMVIERSAAGSSGGIDVIPQETLVAANYPYLIAKVKKPENGATISFNTYYVTGTMSGIAAGKEVTATKVDFADDSYDYYLTDFSTSSAYASGNIKKVVFTTGTEGTWYVEDLIFANDLTILGVENDVPSERVVKTYLNYGSKIEEENGTVVFEPYILYADSSEEEDFSEVSYVADSDIAVVTRNEDGTATVTAKYNGTVNVTTTLPGGVEYTKTVEISGQAPSATVVYDANTEDEVTGMPEAEVVQSWDNMVDLPTEIPVREGYKFVGWNTTGNVAYVYDKAFWSGDKATVTMKAVWVENDYAYGLFHINAGEEPAGAVYVNGIWTNCSNCVYVGGNVIVPLTDGVGYVLVGETAYKVTADACEALDYVPTKTLPGNEARVTGDTGIRFKASVAHAMRNEGNIAEYGFVVSTENQISDPDTLYLRNVSLNQAVKGVAYSKADGIDKYVDEDDEGVIIAAVLTGVKADKKSYETTIYVRPYMILDSGLEIYGHATSATYYDIAKTIAADMPEDAPYADYINGIIATVEAE